VPWFVVGFVGMSKYSPQWWRKLAPNCWFLATTSFVLGPAAPMLASLAAGEPVRGSFRDRSTFAERSDDSPSATISQVVNVRIWHEGEAEGGRSQFGFAPAVQEVNQACPSFERRRHRCAET